MTLTGWQLAVYEALCDLSGPGCPCVSRHDLLRYRLFSLMERAGSQTREPGQAVSLALQRLRDKGLVEFVGVGTYRLTEPGEARRPMADTLGGTGEMRQKIETDAEGFVVGTEREVVGPRASDLPPAPPPPPAPPGQHGAAGDGPDPRFIGTLVFLTASQLKVDDYQRAQAMTWVERKGRLFDWRLILPLHVNHRESGDYYVVDGQHRTLLLIFIGEGERPVPIYLYERLTPEEEAELYVLTQKPGARRGLTAVDVFWAEYFRGLPEPQGVLEAVSRAGGRVSRSARQHWEPGGTIRAVGDLRRCWRMLGTDGLAGMLLSLKHAWGLGGLGTSGMHLYGTAVFWSLYGAQVDKSSLERDVAKMTPAKLLAEATAAATSLSNDGKAHGLALTLLRLYNKGRTTHRLPLAPLMTVIDRRVRQGSGGAAARRRYQASEAPPAPPETPGEADQGPLAEAQ